jgi:hypothetical protein
MFTDESGVLAKCGTGAGFPQDCAFARPFRFCSSETHHFPGTAGGAAANGQVKSAAANGCDANTLGKAGLIDPLTFCSPIQSTAAAPNNVWEATKQVPKFLPGFTSGEDSIQKMQEDGRLSVEQDRCVYRMPFSMGAYEAQCFVAQCGLSYPLGTVRHISILATKLPIGASIYFKVCDGSNGRNTATCAKDQGGQLRDTGNSVITNDAFEMTPAKNTFEFSTFSSVPVVICAKLVSRQIATIGKRDAEEGESIDEIEASLGIQNIEGVINPEIFVIQSRELRPQRVVNRIRLGLQGIQEVDLNSPQ